MLFTKQNLRGISLLSRIVCFWAGSFVFEQDLPFFEQDLAFSPLQCLHILHGVKPIDQGFTKNSGAPSALATGSLISVEAHFTLHMIKICDYHSHCSICTWWKFVAIIPIVLYEHDDIFLAIVPIVLNVCDERSCSYHCHSSKCDMMKDFCRNEWLVSFEKKRKLQEVKSGIWVLLTGKDSWQEGKIAWVIEIIEGHGYLELMHL